MAASDIAAWIGAGAWAPQIISWVYRRLSKPVLKLVPSATLQMGYTTAGPVISLISNITSNRKDALIEKIYIETKHENGDSRKLTWTYLDEIPQQIRTLGLITAEISKFQSATAVKITTTAPIDKTIIFQDLEYVGRLKKYKDELLEQYNYLKEKKENAIDLLIDTKEFKELSGFFEKGMYWREGKYKLYIYLKERYKQKLFCEKFEIVLSKKDIDELLKNNKDLLTQEIKANLNPNPNDKNTVYPTWRWIYPEIQRI